MFLVSIVHDIVARNKNELVDQLIDLQANCLTDCLMQYRSMKGQGYHSLKVSEGNF